MTNKLQQIIIEKREELKNFIYEPDIKDFPIRASFIDAIKKNKTDKLKIITEFKRFSPSNANINKEADLLTQVKEYQHRNVHALSILTDKRFGGSMQDLIEVTKISQLPILSKDFILQKNQIAYAKMSGASAILLIIKAFENDFDTLSELYNYANELNLDAVVEINNEQELEVAMKIDPKIIAINSRDLSSFIIDTKIFITILPLIPQNIVKIAASGILVKSDVIPIKDLADCILVGTAVMQNPKFLDEIQNEI